MTDIDYSAASSFSPSSTVVIVVVVNLVLLAALAGAVWWTRRHAQQAREASAGVSRADPSSPGHAVLYGTIETQDRERPAVTVTIRERGEEFVEKNRVSHTWKEVDRRVEVEPFTLVLASGFRIRVEPDPDVFLVDKLEISARGNPRTRRASLDHGELAYVDGVLKPDWQPQTDASQVKDGNALYRDAPPSALVMTNGVERMLISTEPLARRHQRRASAHLWMAMLLGLALVVTNTVAFGPTHLVNVAGEVVEPRLVAKNTWTTRNKSTITTHYGLRVSYVDPATNDAVELYDEVGFIAYHEAANGRPVPFRVVRWWPRFFAVGTRAGLDWSLAVLAAGIVVGSLVFYRRKVRGAREWYDQAVVEEHGSGPLQT